MDPAAPSAHCIWLGQERTQLEPDGAGAEAKDRWKYWSRMVGIDSGSGDSSEVSMGCEAEKRARYQSDARLKSGREHPIAAARAQASEAMAKAEATLGWRPSSPAGGGAAYVGVARCAHLAKDGQLEPGGHLKARLQSLGPVGYGDT